VKARNLLHVLLVAIATSALAGTAPDAIASCSPGITFQDAFYQHAETKKGLAQGANLHGGVLPGCDDVVVLGPDGQRLDSPPPDVPVELQRIRGVSPKLAVTRPDQPGVFLAPGTFPELPGHPLHKALFGSRSMPDAMRDRTCGPPHRVRGVLPFTPGAIGRITVATPSGVQVDVLVDAGTRFRGARRIAGQPSVAKGDALTVVGRRCADTYERPLVATRIRVRPVNR
jgi:hypothetical protein